MRRSFSIGGALVAVAATVTLVTVGSTQADAPRGADPCVTPDTTPDVTPTPDPTPEVTPEITPEAAFRGEAAVTPTTECDPDGGSGAGLPDAGSDSSTFVPIGMVVLTAGAVLIGVSALRRSRPTA